MSSRVTNNLSREKLQQLLAAVGIESQEDTKQNIEAFDYNWNQPHYFGREQSKKLKDFAERAATAMADKLALLCQADFDVTITSTSQHFAGEFLNPSSDSGQSDYYLAFGADKARPCGLVGLPLETAVVLVTQLLGEAKSEEDSEEDSEKNLSELEESLLLDIVSRFVEALYESCANLGFRTADKVVNERFPLELEGPEELFKIDFDINKADSESASKAYFLILCDELAPVVGKTKQADEAFSKADISEAILEHLQQMHVSVTAQLDSVVLTFEQILNLGVDDILMLGRKVDEPVKLVVEGLELFEGLPAKSAGQYALVITKGPIERRADSGDAVR